MSKYSFPDNLSGRHIILASGSPRRKELLSRLGIPFDVARLDEVDESFAPETPAMEVAPMLARRKAEHYRQTHMRSDEVVITADTVVIVDNTVLGKPADENEARRMLEMLSGRTHHVVTGVDVEWTDGSLCRSAITEVTFAPLEGHEIEHYIRQYKPMDKAGAYGIQEWIGCIAISRIEGSFYNVMGLPLHLLYTMLCNIPPIHCGIIIE